MKSKISATQAGLCRKPSMPRLQRIIQPGTLIHVISRFVPGVTIQDDEERCEYLLRIGDEVVRSDWRAISFAVMSTHTHLGLVTGFSPFEVIFRAAHGAFARWMNRRLGRFGPFFASRPTTIVVDLADSIHVVAYLHNNPVRAGLVSRAVDTPWTSHRAYLGMEPAHDWLDITLGLNLVGLPDTTEARLAFDHLINSGATRDDSWLSGQQLAADRRAIRQERGAAIEIGFPCVSLGRNQAQYPLLSDTGLPVRPRWSGDVAAVLQLVSQQTGVSVAQMQSPARQRKVTAARCLAVLTFRNYLGRPLKDVARVLALSGQAASMLAGRASEELHARARNLASVIADPEDPPFATRVAS